MLSESCTKEARTVMLGADDYLIIHDDTEREKFQLVCHH